MTVREERSDDQIAVREVNDRAFGQPLEGQLVDALRAHGGVLLSLVAVVDGQVVGHILYTPASIASDRESVVGAALGPMAVLPEHQRRGIGTKLVEAGNRKLREDARPFVVVLGHAEYYPRFGFTRASESGIRCEWDVPDDVFMVLALDPDRMRGVRGTVRYRPEFAEAA